MNPIIGGQILQAGGSLLNNALSMWYQSKEAEKSRLFNAEQAQIQRDWNERMWNMNNAYNSPSAQIQRAREAGLNPSMLYGQPVAESQQASGGAEASIGIPSVPHLSNPFDGFALLGAQRDLLEAQADEVRSRIPLNQQRTSNLRAQYSDILASVKQRMADVSLKYSQAKLTDEQRNNISFEQMYKSNQLAFDYQRLQNENALTKAQVDNIEANTRETLARAGLAERQLQEMLWTFAIRKAGLEKQNLLTDAQINQANATADKLRKEGIHIDQLIDIDAPQAINAQQWANDMSGQNGKVNQIGANITYQFVKTLESVGGFLK